MRVFAVRGVDWRSQSDWRHLDAQTSGHVGKFVPMVKWSSWKPMGFTHETWETPGAHPVLVRVSYFAWVPFPWVLDLAVKMSLSSSSGEKQGALCHNIESGNVWGVLKMRDPQVTIVFNTAWMIWVTHHNFRNLCMKFHDIWSYMFHVRNIMCQHWGLIFWIYVGKYIPYMEHMGKMYSPRSGPGQFLRFMTDRFKGTRVRVLKEELRNCRNEKRRLPHLFYDILFILIPKKRRNPINPLSTNMAFGKLLDSQVLCFTFDFPTVFSNMLCSEIPELTMEVSRNRGEIIEL